MAQISGNGISSLVELTSIGWDDLFLVAANMDINHMYYDDEKITYDSVAKQMLREISSKYRFKSMAWEDENAYSLSSHNHDTIYRKTTIQKNQSSGIHIATFIENSKNATQVFFPNRIVRKEDPPLIGEIKFVTDTKLRTIDVNSNDFNGWVYANGGEYLKTDFPSAARVFPQSTTDTSKFRVLTLENFFKGTTGDCSEKQYASNTILAHSHTVNMMFQDQTVTANIDLSGTSNYDGNKTGGGHNSNKDDDSHKCSLKLKIDSITFPGGTKTGDANAQNNSITETYPTFNYIPVMIYIGKRGE